MKSVKIVQKMFGIITVKIHKSFIRTLRGEYSYVLSDSPRWGALFFLAQLFQEIQITPPKYQEMPLKQKEVLKWESS